MSASRSRRGSSAGPSPCDDEVDRLGWFDRGVALALPIAAHTRLLVEDAFRDAPEAAFAPARTA